MQAAQRLAIGRCRLTQHLHGGLRAACDRTGVLLIFVAARGVNEHQIGQIVEMFLSEDHFLSLNFQPVAIGVTIAANAPWTGMTTTAWGEVGFISGAGVYLLMTPGGDLELGVKLR